jgi:3-phenylpropionate/trans-cinnamate dioxygenase ferredoxin subunit
MKIFEVADAASIPAGTMKKVSLEGCKILLANLDGTFYALPDRCPHMGGSLSEGKLISGKIVCPNHGSSFDVKTGKNIDGAKMLLMRKKVADIVPYTVQIKGTKVFIQVTEAR